MRGSGGDGAHECVSADLHPRPQPRTTPAAMGCQAGSAVGTLDMLQGAPCNLADSTRAGRHKKRRPVGQKSCWRHPAATAAAPPPAMQQTHRRTDVRAGGPQERTPLPTLPVVVRRVRHNQHVPRVRRVEHGPLSQADAPLLVVCQLQGRAAYEDVRGPRPREPATGVGRGHDCRAAWGRGQTGPGPAG